MTEPDAALSVVPANTVSWDDLQLVFGTRGAASRCQCQRYKLALKESFGSFPAEERAFRLRQQTDCGHPRSKTTSGLLAYLDDEPVGWCAIEPRTEYDGLLRVFRVPWDGRDEDRQDPTVWAVTCLLARAATLEAYPITTTAVISEELHVGTVPTFEAAGLSVVSRPSPRRVVMRIDY